jgi:hypothetical protein
MSSIAGTIDEMLHHPYWKNEDEREIYLFELAMHIYEETCNQCAVTYRNNRRYTPTECFNAIKNMAPPALNFWMKRPPQEECVVVPLIVPQQKSRIRFVDPMQLWIPFPEIILPLAIQA